jgi:L-serine dehydratase
VKAELYGSLGATGKGHGSDKACCSGWKGRGPDQVDPDQVEAKLERIRSQCRLLLAGAHPIAFVEREHLVMHRRQSLPYHPNGMRITAFDAAGQVLASKVYYSVGGGFVVDESAPAPTASWPTRRRSRTPSAPATSCSHSAATSGLSISQLMLENERAWRSDAETRAGLLKIWDVMQLCVRRGCEREGIMPGGLKVRRRAAEMYRKLSANPEASLRDPLTTMDWVNLYALAVNEENAAGGRVVTAPTNGAAGIVPAVLHYYSRFVPGASEEGVIRFLLTAARSASSTRRTPRSPAPRSAARVRSAWPARWPPARSPRCSAARRSRSRTPPRSAWSTIWA